MNNKIILSEIKTNYEFNIVKSLIKNNDLWWKEIRKKDFLYLYYAWKIISFWRIIKWDFKKDSNKYILSSMYVNFNFRWKKIWYTIINQLIDRKLPSWSELFLSCDIWLKKYYENIWFTVIEDWFPSKIKRTIKWWNEKWIEIIVMKYI